MMLIGEGVRQQDDVMTPDRGIMWHAEEIPPMGGSFYAGTGCTKEMADMAIGYANILSQCSLPYISEGNDAEIFVSGATAVKIYDQTVAEYAISLRSFKANIFLKQ